MRLKKLFFYACFALMSIHFANAQIYPGYDFEQPFSSATFSGTLGAVPGGGTFGFYIDDPSLRLTLAGASGARQTYYTLPSTINFTTKLIVEFDWYITNYAAGSGDEGQLQFRSSTATTNNTLFTLFNKQGRNNEIGIIAGGPSNLALSTSMNEAQIARIPNTPVNAWYHVKAEIYRVGANEQRLFVTITGDGGYYEQVMLPYASGFNLTAFAQIYFNMTRTGNITWETRIKNLGVKNASSDPAVAATGVTVSSQYDIIVAAGGTTSLSALVEPFDVSDHSITWSVDNGLATVAAGNPSWTATLTGANAGGGTVTVTATSATGASGTKQITISAVPIPLTDVTISGPTAVSVNATITLAAAVGPGNAANQNVTWSSLTPAIATVNATTGVVTGVSGGTATIRADAADGGGAYDEYQVTVSVTEISYIDMQGALHIFYPGVSTANFTVTPVIYPSDASFKTLTWSTTDAAIATVTPAGVVTLVGGFGKAYIKASSTDGSGVEGYYYIERYAANPFTFFQDFQTNTTGFTLTGYTRSSVEGSQVLHNGVSGQSGGRSATFTVASGNVPQGGVIDLRFDWYASLVTTTNNSGVFSIQDASGTRILSFVADNYSATRETQCTPLRYLVGDYTVDGDVNPPASINFQNVSALDRWYIIEVQLDFLNDELSFTITDRCDPTTFDKIEHLPLSIVSPPQPSIGSFFFNGLRTATHNITFNTRVDNLGWTVVNPTLPTYAVTGLTLSGLDQVAPGEQILVYPKISPLNALNKNVTFSSSDPAIATVVLDTYGRAIVTGVSAGTVTITAASVENPAITASKIITVTPIILPQRQLERLDRGLVAVKVTAGVFLSWRLLGTDPADIAFNLYKNSSATPLNALPLDPAHTNYSDAAGTNTDTYELAVLSGGQEIYRSKPSAVWANQYLRIPVEKPTGYLPNGSAYTNYTIYDGSTADLDGDGEYEIVFLWAPSNLQDNSNAGLTGNVYIDAYKLDGSKLWGAGKWIDLGRNIRAGAHYLPYLVYDFDGCGKAEIVIRTADGTTDTEGTMIGTNMNYVNSDGFILTGPEYVAIFEGATGKLLDYKPYEPARGDVRDWGDGTGNRADRFLAGVAYLDGVHPSAVMTRGYYTRTTLTAWDWDGATLTKRWMFDSNVQGKQYTGQGNHNLSVADVDNDGKDEIIYGALTVNDDGTALYATGLGHGDALHVGKFDPSRPGLQVVSPHEAPFPYGFEMHDAMTGNFAFAVVASSDIGRGITADIDANYTGTESWSSGGLGTYSAQGLRLGGSLGSVNMATYWDGDTGRELFDGGSNPSVTKPSGSGTPPSRSYTNPSIFTFSGASTNGGTKNNPCLQADILGDWREEMILREAGDNALRIYTTVTPTVHTGAGAVPASGIPTLMHDNTYRMAITWQNAGYNQPPHTGFFLGYNMANVPRTDGFAIEITLDPNGGEFDDLTTAVKVIPTISGAYFAMPGISKTGARFLGWFTAGGDEYDPTAVYTQDIEFIAKWSAPTAPLNLTATPDDGEVTLAWTAPTDDGGSPITHYEISIDNGATWITASSLTGHTYTGLTNGVAYTFLVRAVNMAGPGATASVTATPSATPPPAPLKYTITVKISQGEGHVLTDKSEYEANEIVILTIAPGESYKFISILAYLTGSPNIPVALSGAGDNSYTFTMPANHVTVEAAFKLTGWGAAKAIIENTYFSVLQKDANSTSDLRFYLAEIINQLIAGTDFVITYDHIVIFSNFQPAIDGRSDNPSGINGIFEFRVTPPGTSTSAYSGGFIIATYYTGTENILSSKPLTAWAQNGRLYVNGLTPGTSWSVYNFTGVLVYQSIAVTDEADIVLPQGMYIVTSQQESIIVPVN